MIPGFQIYWSELDGWFCVDPDDDGVWLVVVSDSVRVAGLPEDAVELAPADPIMAKALHGRIASDANHIQLLEADNRRLRALLAARGSAA